MHGRKRPPKDAPAPSAEQVATLAKKVESYRSLAGVALQHRHAHARDAGAFKLNGTLVSLNPDVASLWNYRRECLMAQLEVVASEDCSNSSSSGGTAAAPAPTGESEASAPPPAADAGHAAAAWRFSMYGGHAAAAAGAPSPSFPPVSGCASLAPPPRLAVSLDALRAAVAEELRVSQAGIMKNPKSYPAWHHRQWVIQRYGRCAEGAEAEGSSSPVVDLESELALCGTMLAADERNFHCWNYRKWVAWLARTPVASELAFTSALITKNFSNYSAWHYRAFLLPRAAGVALAGKDGAAVVLPAATLGEELSLLRNAYFTEPDDQSAWFYHRWLAGAARDTLVAHGGEEDEGEAREVGRLLVEETKSLQEVSTVEARCKWPRLALAALATQAGDALAAAPALATALAPLAAALSADASPSSSSPSPAGFYAAAARFRADATALDATHAGCYAALDVRRS